MRVWLTAALSVVLFMAGAGQGQAPRLRIVSPDDGGFASGDTMIRAALEPASQKIQRMTFFVDQRLVCTKDREPWECNWSAGNEVVEHFIMVRAYLPDGRPISTTIRTKGLEFPVSVDVDRIHVTVSVLDGNTFVRGLKKESFRIFEDDVRQNVTFFQAENVALELVSGLDLSESMSKVIGEVKENVKRFLSALRPSDRVWVTAFNENYFVLAPPTVDLATRLKRVDYMAAWGMTSLYETIVRSFDLLGKQTGRRALVIFSDGEDTSSRIPRDAVEKLVERNDAIVYIIGQGKAMESPDLKTLCERLAARSGGRAFFPKDMDGLRAAFDAILEELSNQYLLGYEPPSSKRDGRFHRIRVQVDGGYSVHARDGYSMKER